MSKARVQANRRRQNTQTIGAIWDTHDLQRRLRAKGMGVPQSLVPQSLVPQSLEATLVRVRFALPNDGTDLGPAARRADGLARSPPALSPLLRQLVALMSRPPSRSWPAPSCGGRSRIP